MTDQERAKHEQATTVLTAKFSRPASWQAWYAELGIIRPVEAKNQLNTILWLSGTTTTSKSSLAHLMLF